MIPKDDSHVSIGAGGTAFVGPDGVALYRAIVLHGAIRMYARTGMRANRAYTPTAMLKAVSAITGKTYAGKDKYLNAADDLQKWIAAMKAAIPVVDTRE